MRLTVNTFLLIAIIFCVNNIASGQCAHSKSKHCRSRVGTENAGFLNQAHRRRGLGFSSGYHVNSPGTLPHLCWSQYSQLEGPGVVPHYPLYQNTGQAQPGTAPSVIKPTPQHVTRTVPKSDEVHSPTPSRTEVNPMPPEVAPMPDTVKPQQKKQKASPSDIVPEKINVTSPTPINIPAVVPLEQW